MSKKLFIPQHLGMGDAIICNGLVRYMLTKFKQVYIPVLDKYVNSVSYMYRDVLERRINILPINSNMSENHRYSVMYNLPITERQLSDCDILQIGFLLNQSNRGRLYEYYARQFGLNGVYYQASLLDKDIQYKYYRCDRDLCRLDYLYKTILDSNLPYVFYHDDPSRNIVISNFKSDKKIVFPYEYYTDNIFDYGKIILNAELIHMIDSSFTLVADHLDLSRVKIKRVYKYPRPLQLTALTKYQSDFELVWSKDEDLSTDLTITD